MLFVQYGNNDLMASEMLFENVNGQQTDRRTPDVSTYYKLDIVLRDILICSILVSTCMQGLY